MIRCGAVMPQRKIVFPESVQLLDPDSGQPLAGPEGLLDFTSFLRKLFNNPLWNESWKQGMAQRSIAQAVKEAIAEKRPAVLIAEEDWEFLATAAKTPRSAVFVAGMGMQVISGFGYHPAVAGQLIPMQLAIINAEVV